MSHYSQSAAHYPLPAAAYAGHPPPGLEIPPPPPPHPVTAHPGYHPYGGNHPYPNNAYAGLPLSHQYPPGYAPHPATYASPPSAPPALYPDARLAGYPSPAVPPPPPMSPYPPNPAPVVVYANGQPSPAPSLGPQQGYYSSMLNSPLPSPVTSPRSAYSLSSHALSVRTSAPTSPQHNGLKSPISTSSKSPIASMKSPGAFPPPKSPSHSKSPIHAPPSPSTKSPQKSPDKTPTSQNNGPLRSLEKMIFTEKQSDREVSDADCKMNILAESNPPRSDSCPRRSSSHSGDDQKPGSRAEPEPEASTSSAPTPDGKKKRGRPVGSVSRPRKRGPDGEELPPKRKRTKKVDAKTALNSMPISKPDKHDKRGPRIRVDGLRSNPKSCTVINNLSHSDEKDKKRGGVEPSKTERVNKLTESVKLTDAAWVCCFCGWGSTHTSLGDLFGPYQIEGFRPPRRDAPRRRKRRNSQCSDDGERVRSLSGEGPPGETWVHEECATWAEGVYMVGYRIQGLDEAARIARQTQCSACKVDGATIGCLHKGCQQKYHYPCAINKECLLNEENFSLVCHKHKDKKIRMADNRFTTHS